MDKRHLLMLALTLLLTATIFLIDLATELGFADGVLYITVVLLSVYLPSDRYILRLAVLCSGLVVLGYWFSPVGGEPWKVMANRLISIYAIWVTAVLSWYRRKGEQKREKIIAELELANRNLEGFSSAVSHDLRSPLITIEGLAGRLLKSHADRLDPRAQELLLAISKNSQKASQLIDDLLAFSRASTREIKKNPIAMEELAREVYAELAPVAGGRDIRFECKGLPPASGDPAMIHQVFTNLVGNAIKFTRTRETALIQVGGYKGREENLYFVKDNGAGFPPEAADRLFHFFQRLHAASRFEGTGLGLVIVRTIIEKHGGRVWAEGKPDQGAAFFFTLPRRK